MRLIYLLVSISLMYSCKQKSESTTVLEIEKPKQETIDEIQTSPIVKELTEFAEVTLADTINLNKVFLVKEIDEQGNVKTTDLKTGINLYKKTLNSQQSTMFPIFEITNSSKVILVAKSKGYMGAIWAKILMDKTTLEIIKVQFDHKGESEGYGAAFTYTSFENMFTEAKISTTRNTFGLKQDHKDLIQGNQTVDGISGATITSKAAVEMMNTGLKKYKNYFL